MASVKGFTGVSIPQPWEVVKEFDFTTHSGSGGLTHTFSDGVAYEWEGVDWTCQNLSSNGTSIKFINGISR